MAFWDVDRFVYMAGFCKQGLLLNRHGVAGSKEQSIVSGCRHAGTESWSKVGS